VQPEPPQRPVLTPEQSIDKVMSAPDVDTAIAQAKDIAPVGAVVNGPEDIRAEMLKIRDLKQQQAVEAAKPTFSEEMDQVRQQAEQEKAQQLEADQAGLGEIAEYRARQLDDLANQHDQLVQQHNDLAFEAANKGDTEAGKVALDRANDFMQSASGLRAGAESVRKGFAGAKILSPEDLPDVPSNSGPSISRGEAQAMADRLSLSGVRAVFYEPGKEGDLGFQGAARGNTIYLDATNRQQAVHAVEGHEFDHIIRQAAPDLHAPFAQAVEKTMDAGKYLSYANYLNWIPRQWSEMQLKAGKTAEQILNEGLKVSGNSLDALKTELSADARGNRHLESRPFWQSVLNELGQRDVGLVQKFRNIVGLAAERLKGRGYAVDQLFSNLDEIRQQAAATQARFMEKRLAERATPVPTEPLLSPKRTTDDGHQLTDKGYVGAPAGLTPQGLGRLRKQLEGLAHEGEPGRFWYEQSGSAIKQAAGGDVEKASKIAGLLSIYSPQANVASNTTFALKALYQHANGEPIKVSTRDRDSKAQAWLDGRMGEKEALAIKTGNFYRNLMRTVDPERYGYDKQGSTIDRWMARAFGYKSTAIGSEARYEFANRETQRLAKQLGWEPQQAQAAIWVAIKSRIESIKDAAREIGIENGWLNKKVTVSKGKESISWEPKPEFREAYESKILEMALGLPADKEGIAKAKYDFGDAIRERLAQISWEAKPGETTGHLPGIHKAPLEQQVEYLNAIDRALRDGEGNDLIAKKLGLPMFDTLFGPSAWKGDVAAGAQSRLPVPPPKEGMLPAATKLINAYAAIRGLVTHQEGVYWHFPRYKAGIKNENGVELNFGRTPTVDEMKQLYGAISQQAGHTEWAPAITDTGVRILNFTDVPNPVFHATIKQALESLGPDFISEHQEFKRFASEGDAITNDWSKGDADYRSRISETGRPDLQKWVDDTLAPRIAEVDRAFAEKYGWDRPQYSPTREETGNPGQVAYSTSREALRERLASFLQRPREAIADLKRAIVPMAEGSDEARVIAKDFANEMRKSQDQWQQFDTLLTKRFTEEQRQKMWEAADEENDLRREGVTAPSRGLGRLNPEERAAVEMLHDYGEELMQRAKAAGMFEGEGVPYWTPRMAVMIDGHGEVARLPSKGERGTDARNLSTQAGSLKKRKYLTAAETEAAASQLAQDKGGATALLVRDIRTMPMAMSRLEKAIAGRELINQVKALGELTGRDLVAPGAAEPGGRYFTLDHPAFSSWRPRFQDGQIVLKEDGDPVMDRVPMKIAKEFEGPLKAVLSDQQPSWYRGLMDLKAKSMQVIMMSPMIHNMVVWGRAFPAMDAKGKVTLGVYTYVTGHRAKLDPAIRREAIGAGLVPMGRNGAYTDITGIMQDPNLVPGRSLTAKLLAAPVAIISEPAATAVKKAVDAAGELWHQTLLWDRVADVQMGLYVTMRDSALNKGLSLEDASRVAAHLANRYVGALPREAMSEFSRRFLNVVLFSRSFTIGNLGAMKDMLMGLPKDVQAQIKMSSGEVALSTAQNMARRKAIGAFVTDIALMYAVNSALQSYLETRNGDKDWEQIKAEYAARYGKTVEKLFDDPVSALGHPFHTLEGLTPQADNEPGKEHRVKVGPVGEGPRELYVRPPMGKVGEEFENYISFPQGTMKQLHDKLSPFVRPLVDIANNDRGFGQPVFDSTKDASLLKNLGRIVTHIMAAQIPTDQLVAGLNLMTGKSNEVDAKKLWGPLVGFTFSQGHPSGPEAGIAAAAKEEYEKKVALVMPDVKKLLKDGKEDEAEQLLEQTGMTPKEIGRLITRQETPREGPSRQALREFNRHASEDMKDRMQRQSGR
jgi:hypothetical protein